MNARYLTSESEALKKAMIKVNIFNLGILYPLPLSLIRMLFYKSYVPEPKFSFDSPKKPAIKEKPAIPEAKPEQSNSLKFKYRILPTYNYKEVAFIIAWNFFAVGISVSLFSFGLAV